MPFPEGKPVKAGSVRSLQSTGLSAFAKHHNRACWSRKNHLNGVVTMDRRSIIKHAGIAGVLAAGAAPAVHAQATIRWRLASSFPKALDTIFGAADVFAKKVG